MNILIFSKLNYCEEQNLFIGKTIVIAGKEKIYDYRKQFKDLSENESEKNFLCAWLSSIHSLELQKKLNLRHDKIKLFVNEKLYYNILNSSNLGVYEKLRNIIIRYNIGLKKDIKEKKVKKELNPNKQTFIKSSALQTIQRMFEKKHLVVFDLEFNNDSKHSIINEVISIGAVKLDKDLNIVDKFYSTVKPSFITQLTTFCKRLTKLTQEEIDNSRLFNEVMILFKKWIGEDCVLIQWSKNDKHMLKEGFKINNSVNIFKDNEFVDFQQILIGALEFKDCISLVKAIDLYEVDITGYHHNSFFDALNTAKVFISFCNNIERLEYYKERLLKASLLNWNFGDIKSVDNLKNVV